MGTIPIYINNIPYAADSCTSYSSFCNFFCALSHASAARCACFSRIMSRHSSSIFSCCFHSHQRTAHIQEHRQTMPKTRPMTISAPETQSGQLSTMLQPLDFVTLFLKEVRGANSKRHDPFMELHPPGFVNHRQLSAFSSVPSTRLYRT